MIAKKLKYKSVFISDSHLGSKGCKAKSLYEFLDSIDGRVEKLFLVGDIVDLWAMKIKWYVPQKHSNVLRKFLGIAKRSETEVIYIPGNHDEDCREMIGHEFGKIKIMEDYVYTGINGKVYWILHGDVFDIFMHDSHKWISFAGTILYEWLLMINHVYNKTRKMFGMEYWSLAKHIKTKVKDVTKVINQYETTLTNVAKNKGYDGVICGHIHKPEILTIQGIEYLNCGDWIENCSALIETIDGKFELINFGGGHND